MIEIRQTNEFARWLRNLKDANSKARIARRLSRMSNGYFGDVKSIGDGVSELRFHVGPGFRVYFTRRNQQLIILLAGGDKDSQATDIKTAQALANALEE